METILEQLRQIEMEKTLSNLESGTPVGKEPNRPREDQPVLRGIYRCRACGYIFNEEMEGKPFSTLTECPVCHVSPGGFMQLR